MILFFIYLYLIFKIQLYLYFIFIIVIYLLIHPDLVISDRIQDLYHFKINALIIIDL